MEATDDPAPVSAETATHAYGEQELAGFQKLAEERRDYSRERCLEEFGEQAVKVAPDGSWVCSVGSLADKRKAVEMTGRARKRSVELAACAGGVRGQVTLQTRDGRRVDVSPQHQELLERRFGARRAKRRPVVKRTEFSVGATLLRDGVWQRYLGNGRWEGVRE